MDHPKCGEVPIRHPFEVWPTEAVAQLRSFLQGEIPRLGTNDRLIWFYQDYLWSVAFNLLLLKQRCIGVISTTSIGEPDFVDNNNAEDSAGL